MLYAILKIYSRLAIRIYCRNIKLTNSKLLQSKGPLIIAANHPNSVMDAVIIDTLFNQPVYSLARGDAFRSKLIAIILRALKIYPVYRQKEGKENLHRNYHTFDACLEIFKKNGIVLVFAEALCENEWHLRPLRKGTARIVLSAWQENIPLRILPVGLNYSSFHLFSKNVHLNIGEFISRDQTEGPLDEEGKVLNELTDGIESQLNKIVYEINGEDKKKQAEIFCIPVSKAKRILLAIPALAGVLTHFPLYVPIQRISWQKARYSGHYDSIVTGLLFLSYPFYLLIWAAFGVCLSGNWYWMLVFVLFPFFAWSYIQLKQQTDS